MSMTRYLIRPICNQAGYEAALEPLDRLVRSAPERVGAAELSEADP